MVVLDIMSSADVSPLSGGPYIKKSVEGVEKSRPEIGGRDELSQTFYQVLPLSLAYNTFISSLVLIRPHSYHPKAPGYL